MYEQLMVELQNEDVASFRNFLRMDPPMFQELLQRVGPHIQKKDTFFRRSLTPGLKFFVLFFHEEMFFLFFKTFLFLLLTGQIKKFDNPVLRRLCEGSFTTSRRNQIQIYLCCFFVFFLKTDEK